MMLTYALSCTWAVHGWSQAGLVEWKEVHVAYLGLASITATMATLLMSSLAVEWLGRRLMVPQLLKASLRSPFREDTDGFMSFDFCPFGEASQHPTSSDFIVTNFQWCSF
jgi:hypothetical protein